MLRVRSCAPADAPLLVRALNECLYKDYKFRVVLTEERFAEDNHAHDVDLSATLLALDGESPLGVALVARRGAEAWIAGMGVSAELRGRGLGSELLRRVKEHLIAVGVRTVLLEVLVENGAARRCYEKAGFAPVRRYSCFRGSAARAGLGAPSIEIRVAKAETLVDEHASFHSVEQCWQRNLVTLGRRAPTLKGLVAVSDGEVVGCLLHGNSAISDVGFRPGREALTGILPPLLEAAFGARPFAIVNVPDDDPLHAAMTGSGFEVYAEQLDMRCSL